VSTKGRAVSSPTQPVQLCRQVLGFAGLASNLYSIVT